VIAKGIARHHGGRVLRTGIKRSEGDFAEVRTTGRVAVFAIIAGSAGGSDKQEPVGKNKFGGAIIELNEAFQKNPGRPGHDGEPENETAIPDGWMKGQVEVSAAWMRALKTETRQKLGGAATGEGIGKGSRKSGSTCGGWRDGP